MVFMLNFVVYTPVSAYYSTSSLQHTLLSDSKLISCNNNGIVIFTCLVKTNVERSVMPTSDQPLLLHSFKSGTWQGSDISSLTSKRLCDQDDTVGFSHTASLVSSGAYFVYLVQICLPVSAGDSFYISASYSSYCVNYGTASYVFLPGGSGVRKCWIQSGINHSGESFDFELTSDNQFIFYIFTSSSWHNSYVNFSSSSSSEFLHSELSDCTYICGSRRHQLYTSNYGLSTGDTVSFKLRSNLTCFCIVGYELYSDGTSFPGLDDSDHMGGSSDDDSVGSTDLSGVHSRLDAIIALLEASGSFFTPEDFWEVYKSGLEEMFGIEDSEPLEPPPEDTTEETTEPTSSPFDVGIDEEQVAEALSYVSTDLGDTVTGSGGALSFFWFITDRFLTTCDLYVVAGLSLMFCLGCWILRS